jgi:hypothetical protein
MVLIRSQHLLHVDTASRQHHRELAIPLLCVDPAPEIARSTDVLDATESVSASVSFDGAYNLFRIALLPLVSSEPILFHGAIAVAGVHWANKLKGVRRNLGQLDANGQQQLEILQLASEVNPRPDQY